MDSLMIATMNQRWHLWWLLLARLMLMINDHDFFLTPWPASFSLKQCGFWCSVWFLISSCHLPFVKNLCWGEVNIWLSVLRGARLKRFPPPETEWCPEENAGRSCIAPSKPSWISWTDPAGHWSTWIGTHELVSKVLHKKEYSRLLTSKMIKILSWRSWIWCDIINYKL